VVHEMEKAQVVFDHFDAIIGSYVEHTSTLDFNVPYVDLSGLFFFVASLKLRYGTSLGQCRRIKPPVRMVSRGCSMKQPDLSSNMTSCKFSTLFGS
jgi:hypothetical protein